MIYIFGSTIHDVPAVSKMYPELHFKQFDEVDPVQEIHDLSHRPHDPSVLTYYPTLQEKEHYYSNKVYPVSHDEQVSLDFESVLSVN